MDNKLYTFCLKGPQIAFRKKITSERKKIKKMLLIKK